jgi:hypothetical protein
MTSALVSLSPGSIISVSGITSAIVSLSAGTQVIVSGTVTTVDSGGGGTNYFRFTSTYTAAQTNAVLKSCEAIGGSASAYYVTDVVFANSSTHGAFSLIESRPNAAIRTLLDRVYLVDCGGAVINLKSPIVLDTNSALCFTSFSATSHSVTVVGYIA